MTIKTLKEFAIAGRKGAGTGTISEMRAEIGKLRAENMVLARAVTGKDDCEGLAPQQVAGVLMCTAVEVDACEIEEETGMTVKATVAVDEDSFEVYVKLSFKGIKEPDDIEEPGVLAQPATATRSIHMEPCLPVDEEEKCSDDKAMEEALLATTRSLPVDADDPDDEPLDVEFEPEPEKGAVAPPTTNPCFADDFDDDDDDADKGRVPV